MTEVTSLSYSKLASFLRCPKSFYFRYVLQIPTPLKGRMLVGRAYHHALAVAESRKALLNEELAPDEVADAFSSFWEKELRDKLVYDEAGEEKIEAAVVDFEDDEPGELKDSGIKLAQLYVKEVLPKLEVVNVEKRLAMDVEGIPFVGYVDLLINLNGSEAVVDHKFSKRRMSAEDAEKDLQITSYAMLLGRPAVGQFHQALDTKEKKIEVIETKRDEGDIGWLKQVVVGAWHQIQSDNFYCNPLNWTCSESACSYWLTCKKPWF